jgi:hypothetical protein
MTALVMSPSADSQACLAADKEDATMDPWVHDTSLSPRSCHSSDGPTASVDGIPPSSHLPLPVDRSTIEAPGTQTATANPEIRERHEYDSDPVPLEELLRERDQHDDSKTENSNLCKDCGMWTKRDLVVPSSGLYRPWFFSRFAKGWIGISRAHALSDIRCILGSSSRPRNKDSNCREREELEGQTDKDRTCRSKRSYKPEDSSDDTMESTDEDPETWVGCDECGKWRKIGDLQIDTESSFFCSMLPGITCSTPEEAWNEPVSQAYVKILKLVYGGGTCLYLQMGPFPCLLPSAMTLRRRLLPRRH